MSAIADADIIIDSTKKRSKIKANGKEEKIATETVGAAYPPEQRLKLRNETPRD